MTLPSYYDIKPLPKPSRPASHRRTLSSFAASSPGTSRNSSLNKVWSEDYYSYDCEIDTQGQQDKEEGSQITIPSPATLTSRPFPRSIPLTDLEDAYPPRQPRTHQRSLTALLPFTKSPSRSPERKSPKKEKTQIEFEDEFMPTLTGDRDGVIRIEEKEKPRGGLASWFSGSSAPVAIGVPATEPESLSPSKMSSRETSPERKLRRPTLPSLDSGSSTPTKANTSTGRFNFFSSPKSTPKTETIQLPTHMMDSDEFLTLDISAALFPSSSPTSQDPFSPAAFKNLLMNAEGLLLKLQTAYKLRTLSLHELSSDHDAQKDELEEANTRAQCLKAQLDEMSNKLLEQDKVVEELVMELAKERQARNEEKEARIKASRSSNLNASLYPHLQKVRIWDSATYARDGGIVRGVRETSESDTDAGSSTESVFSRSRSPTLTVNSAISASSTLTNDSAEILQASVGRVVSLSSPTHLLNPQRPKMVQQPSTFQKILNGINPTSQTKENEGEFGGMGLENGCRNCQGKMRA